MGGALLHQPWLAAAACGALCVWCAWLVVLPTEEEDGGRPIIRSYALAAEAGERGAPGALSGTVVARYRPGLENICI